MSTPGQGIGKLQNLVITGNPTVDAILRYVLVAAFTGITGAILGWLNREGFHDPNLVIYVPMGVASVLSGLVLALWGIIRTSKNEAIVRLREAVAVQAGINVAEAQDVPTPAVVTVAGAQKIIAEHAPEALPLTEKEVSTKENGK